MPRAVMGLILVAALSLPATGEELALGPETVIAVPDGKPDREVSAAAALLQEWLRKAARTDAGFEIVSEGRVPEAVATPVIALDRTRRLKPEWVEGLWRDGYIIRRQGNAIVICGGRSSGTFHGAVAFLDRCCGVRFYMPTDLFTSLPADPRLAVSDLSLRVEPFVKSCFMSGISRPFETVWARRVGAIRRLGGTHQHNMYHVFPADKYAAERIEIYPILNGSRYIPKSQADQGWQPCFTEPKTLEAGVESALAYFNTRPGDLYLSFSIQDGSRFCECGRCLALVKAAEADDPKLGRTRAYSEMYWRFMNALAERVSEKLPDKRLTALAYGQTRLPPPFKLHPILIIFTNFHIAELPADNFMVADAAGTSPLDQWLNLCSHYGNHDWYQGGGYLLPRIYSGHWSTFMRRLAERLPEAYMHAESYPNWGFDGPKLYILSRLWWDPRTDVNALLDQFCRDLFGPAATPMADYFRTCERLWDRLDTVDGPERKIARWETQFLTTPPSREMIAQCRVFLDRAAEQAQTDEQRKRVALFSKCFRLSEYLFGFMAFDPPSPNEYQTVLAFARDHIATDPLCYHWPSKVEEAVTETFWAAVRGRYAKVSVPRIAAPRLDGAEDAAWKDAAPGAGFVEKGRGEDSQNTTVRVGCDDSALHFFVVCPRKDMHTLVETDDDSWRSDNVELFFDTNGDRKPDRHLWVKTTGRVVDWPRGNARAALLRAAVRKEAARYVVHITVPFEYLDLAPTTGAALNLQLIRNEFEKGETRNEQRYMAFWNAELLLP